MQEQHVTYIAEKLSEIFSVEFVVTAINDINKKGDDLGQEKEQETA